MLGDIAGHLLVVHFPPFVRVPAGQRFKRSTSDALLSVTLLLG
jgi:hypothetical protein